MSQIDYFATLGAIREMSHRHQPFVLRQATFRKSIEPLCIGMLAGMES
jgi:hypothetical protein